MKCLRPALRVGEMPNLLGACRQPSTNLRPHNRSCRLAALEDAPRGNRRAIRRDLNWSFSCIAGECRTCIARHDPSQARYLRPCDQRRRLGKEALFLLSLNSSFSLHGNLGGVKGGIRLRCAMKITRDASVGRSPEQQNM